MTSQLSSSRRSATASAGVLWATGLGFLLLVAAGTYGLSQLSGADLWPDAATWAENPSTPLHWAMWVLGDTNEAPFFKSALAAVGMTAGALLAQHLWRRRRAAMGFPIVYGTGLLGWVLVASWTSLILANLAFGWTITAETPWQPTFVTFVSVPAAVVIIYGGGWARAMTAAVLGAMLTTPIAILAVNYVCVPLDLPNVVGNVTGMWGGGLIAFAICRYLPHMRSDPAPTDVSVEETDSLGGPDEAATEANAASVGTKPSWVVRRALADFTEPVFYGNEWASAGLILGVTLEFLLNPSSPVYGTGMLPAVLMAQFIASTVAVLLFRKQWAEQGFYPTFIPIVSVAPAIVLAFGATPLVIISAGLLGAITAPPLGAYFARLLPKDFHPFIAYVFTMTVTVAVLVPILKQVPGFGA